jgi:hypothetical protein
MNVAFELVFGLAKLRKWSRASGQLKCRRLALRPVGIGQPPKFANGGFLEVKIGSMALRKSWQSPRPFLCRLLPMEKPSRILETGHSSPQC